MISISLRILILGNLANDGYSVAKALWKMNVDVDLAVNSSDFGMALPEWEDGDISDTTDPYNINKEQMKKTILCDRIHYFDFLNKIPLRKNLVGKVMARINLIKMIRQYDIIEVHVPYVIYSQFTGVPNVVYDAGWIRYFPYENSIRAKLARRGYSKAKGIIITNPDTYAISDTLPYLNEKQIYFSPFAIDPEKYYPTDMEDLRSKYIINNDGILLFSPSRQHWFEKGNDKMIKAFARFVKVFSNSKLVMVDWSTDAQKSKDLVNSLNISEKVNWIKPVAKKQLIGYYNAADIILDQFILGSWGTTTPEAMSCQKPVLMFYKEEYIKRALGENPPILNSFSEQDIFSNLVKLAKDPDFRISLGKKSREWIIKTHSPDIVAKKHLQILSQFV
ncbi:MAG: glycosyltransferase family 4 protein [Nitrososphaeraceae archaeon]